ncbi:ATP-binding protein [Methylobacterium bullatum]|uniref:C4-dicarboxylate transport sensor protein DctB n=1 Tax=Methylobacterium bullatum TaxID=570505 RepID=A0AAV4Z9C7_9HYPH|nr:ATP-binding protein [Methylobacterium bullatum]MBD8904418.1 two-component sensor histidine kinase [Methylobacterium bullatum]GJD40180.1 C4-dicarboxylate transport sensor protein DctB [Methylobacterium bullatum]
MNSNVPPREGTDRGFLKRSRRSLALAASLVLVWVAAWLAGQAAERWALSDLRRTAQSTLALQVGALRAEMQKQASLPLALAADPEIAAVAGPDPTPAMVEQVSKRLAQVAAATGSAVIYVIRPDGITVAASNAEAERSFVGRDYAFRPYFRQAMADGAGSQFALGTVSGRAGLYLSRRIGEAGGVVVVKIEFDGVEAAWRQSGDGVFVADARGIVLVASDPAWSFATLREVGDDERKRIRAALEFGEAPLSALPLHPVGGMQDLVRVGRGSRTARTVLALDAPIPGTDWRLHTLTPVGPAVDRERMQAWIIAALGTGLACIGIATLAGRRRRTRRHLAQAAARREELERSVRERTLELTDANRLLRLEIEERRRAEEERRQAEAERERLGRELAQAGRLAALGQFAASMAHEINQPLAAIRSYADNAAILVRRGRGEEAAENAFAIGRLTDRIGGLTRQLKGFARRSSPRREPVALADILANSLELVEARAQAARIAISAERPAPGLYVLGDGPRLEQVVVNLLQNALDAAAGSTDPRVSLLVRDVPDNRVAIEVRDTGPGLPETIRAQVFDAFFTTKSDGLGLGLAIARGIVEDCGGSLNAMDDPAGGAVFRMELAKAPVETTP